MNVDYIRLWSTARQISEIVFNRAADTGVQMTTEQARGVMWSAVNLAVLAHTPNPEKTDG